MDILQLEGKVALVTGAGQGVGSQIARQLATQGARVVVNDYHESRALAVAAEIGPDRCVGLQADVTAFESVGRMAAAAFEHFGTVDILVNNAGNAGADPSGLTGKPFWEQDPDEWAAWLEVNLRGVMNSCRHFLPRMVEQGSGSIVNIISDAGRVGEAHREVYSGAKAGTAGFTRALARSLGQYGVRANCVAIAATETPTTERFLNNPDFARKALSGYVIRRFGKPHDVANMVLFLASEGASSWITGQTYPVNGGFDMAM